MVIGVGTAVTIFPVNGLIAGIYGIYISQNVRTENNFLPYTGKLSLKKICYFLTFDFFSAFFSPSTFGKSSSSVFSP
jgi:hypothetical protein